MKRLILCAALSLCIYSLYSMEEQSTEMQKKQNALSNFIWALSFNDEDQLALGFGDVIKVWDQKLEKFTQKIPVKKLLLSVNFCAKNKLIFTAGQSFQKTNIVIWNEKTQKQDQIFRKYFTDSQENTCSKDGLFCLHSAIETGNSIWNIQEKKCVQTLTSQEEQGIDSLAFSCDTKKCATGGFMRLTQLYDVETGQATMSLEEKNSTALAFVPNKNMLISSPRNEKTINTWDLSSGKIIQRVESDDNVLALACSSNNNTVAYSQAGNGEVNYFTIENNSSMSKPTEISFYLLS